MTVVPHTVPPTRICRETRKRLGVSIAAFSKMLGVNEYTVWRWENEKSPVSPFYVGVLRALAVVTAADEVYARGLVAGLSSENDPLRVLSNFLALFYGFCPPTAKPTPQK